MDQLSQLTKDMTFSWEEYTFELTPAVISFLHHWNFGTSTQYYRKRNKFIILPDHKGKLVKIQDIDSALNAALNRYNELTSLAFEKRD